jgi:hypothetical protein
VNHAARAGVQYGAQSPGTAVDKTGMQQAALNDGTDIAGLSAVASVFCQCDDGSSSAQCLSIDCGTKRLITFVQVDTSAQFKPFFANVLPAMTMKGKAVSRASNG